SGSNTGNRTRRESPMARPHIEFIRSQEVEETDATAPFEGLRERRLSEDDETAAYTSLIELPAGREVDLSGLARPVELFSLRGEARLGGDRLGRGCYVYLESGLEGAVLAADEDTLVLAMVEDEREPGPSGAWEGGATAQR